MGRHTARQTPRPAIGTRLGRTYYCADPAELPRVSKTKSAIHVECTGKSAKVRMPGHDVALSVNRATARAWSGKHTARQTSGRLWDRLDRTYECADPAELSKTESAIHVRGYRKICQNPYARSMMLRCPVNRATPRTRSGSHTARQTPGRLRGPVWVAPDECAHPAELIRVSKTESAIHVRVYRKICQNPYAGSRCCVVSEQGDSTGTEWKGHTARQTSGGLWGPVWVGPTSVPTQPSSHESPRPSRRFTLEGTGKSAKIRMPGHDVALSVNRATSRIRSGSHTARQTPGRLWGPVWVAPDECAHASRAHTSLQDRVGDHVRVYQKICQNPYAGSRCCVVSEQGESTDTEWKSHGQRDA